MGSPLTRDKVNKKVEYDVNPGSLSLTEIDKQNVMNRMPTSTSAEYVAKSMGRKEFIEGCMLSEHPKVKAFVTIYNSLSPKEHEETSLDDICLKVDLSPDLLIGNVAQSLARYNLNITRMLIAINQPKVVKKNIEMAQTSEGIEDRKMFLNMSGLQTEPSKGPLISQTFNTNNIPAFEKDPTLDIGGDDVIDITGTFVDKGDDPNREG